MRTHRHIAKNLRWSVLTKIIFFFLLSCHHGSIYYRGLGAENSTRARNAGWDPKGGQPDHRGPRRLWANTEQPGLRGHGCYKVVSSVTEPAAWLLSPQGGVLWGGGAASDLQKHVGGPMAHRPSKRPVVTASEKPGAGAGGWRECDSSMQMDLLLLFIIIIFTVIISKGRLVPEPPIWPVASAQQ